MATLGDKVIEFSTYTYGFEEFEDNPCISKVVEYNKKFLQWFFVYFGYSEKEK